MKKENLTIGDEIKKTSSFELNPYNLRVYMKPKNYLFIRYLQHILDQYWKKNSSNSGETIHEVFFNKVVSELIRKNKKLNFITRGWYLYGIEVAKPSLNQISSRIPTIEELTRGTDFNKTEIKDLEKQAVKIADEFNCNKSSFEWKKKQYKDFNEKVYSTKLELQKAMKDRDVSQINLKLSSLSLALKIKKYKVENGKYALLEFIDIAKKIIISNDYSIPSFDRFRKSFDDAWKYFACVNLYNTAEGINAEDIRLNTTEKINSALKKVYKSFRELNKDIKIKKFKVKIAPDAVQKDILKSINKI